MFKIQAFNDIFAPISVGIVLRDNHYYLVDFSTEKATHLQEEGHALLGTIERENPIHFRIDSEGISLANESDEFMSLKPDCFSYHKRPKEDRFNQYCVNLTSATVDFYYKDSPGDKKYVANGLKILREYSHMKKTEDSKDGGIAQKKIIAQMEDGLPVSQEFYRHFSEEGCLDAFDSKEMVLNTSLKEYILDVASDSSSIQSLISIMDTMVPDISSYLAQKNQIFQDLFQEIQKKKNQI